MKVQICAVGTKMPDWVETGYTTYAQRLTQEVRLQLLEIPAGKRTKNADTHGLVQQESQALLAACPANYYRVALDVKGTELSTAQLAEQLKQWLQLGKHISLLIGGPEGLSADCLKQVEFRWSLSPLTLPHPLVRILVAEQIYRAWTLLSGHPYHR